MDVYRPEPAALSSMAATTGNLMRETQWIEWTRTRLQPQKRGELLTALSSQQKAHLLEHDYVWVKGIGVLWEPSDGALRRARFTHGTHFRTQRGVFYIDSEGSAHELSDHRNHPKSAAGTPRLLGDTMRSDDIGAATVSTTRPPSQRIPLAQCVEHRTQRLLEQAPSSGGH
jgi:hypothetical protein